MEFVRSPPAGTWFIKRALGWRARTTGETVDGRPVVVWNGTRLTARHHPVDGRYFRLLVPCESCGAETTIRTHQIHRRQDLSAALSQPPGVPIVCPDCVESRTGSVPSAPWADETWPEGTTWPEATALHDLLAARRSAE